MCSITPISNGKEKNLDVAMVPKHFQIHSLHVKLWLCPHRVGWDPHGSLTQFNKLSIKGSYLEEAKVIGCRGISGHFNWYPLKIHEKDFKRWKNWLPKAWQIYNAMIEILHIMSYLITHLHHITQLVLLHCSAKYSLCLLSFFLTSN